MKTIKLLSISILVILFTVSCSSDDDGPSGPTVSNQVFATWNLAIISENGVLETDIPCDSALKYTFNSNKTYSKVTFTDSSDGNSCDESLVISGSWEVVEDDVLQLTPSSSTFEVETISIELFNDNQSLRIERSSTLTEIYNKQ